MSRRVQRCAGSMPALRCMQQCSQDEPDLERAHAPSPTTLSLQGRATLRKFLLRICNVYERSDTMTQAAVQAMLEITAEAGVGDESWKANIPRTFKALLVALEQLGVNAEAQT